MDAVADLSDGVLARIAAEDLEFDLLMLVAPVLRLRPELEMVFATIRRAGGDPHLTGSGPTVFSVSDDPERTASVRDSLRIAGIRAMTTRYAAAAATIEPSMQEESSA